MQQHCVSLQNTDHDDRAEFIFQSHSVINAYVNYLVKTREVVFKAADVLKSNAKAVLHLFESPNSLEAFEDLFSKFQYQHKTRWIILYIIMDKLMRGFFKQKLEGRMLDEHINLLNMSISSLQPRIKTKTASSLITKYESEDDSSASTTDTEYSPEKKSYMNERVRILYSSGSGYFMGTVIEQNATHAKVLFDDGEEVVYTLKKIKVGVNSAAKEKKRAETTVHGLLYFLK